MKSKYEFPAIIARANNLNSLYSLCEKQKTVSTKVLERKLDEIANYQRELVREHMEYINQPDGLGDY